MSGAVDEASGDSFAEVFAAAVRRRGLSLDRLSARLGAEGLPVSTATLSYWQTGRSVPTRARSQRVVEAIEQLLDVEPGSLAERTSHFLRNAETPWQEMLPSDASAQILAEMGYTRPSLGLHSVFTQDYVRLGAHRQELSQTTTALLKIERALRGWPAVFVQESEDDALVQVTNTHNCVLGEHVTIPDLRLFAGELLFLEPKRGGDLVQTSYTVQWDDSRTESARMARGVTRGLRGATLEVQFHPDAVARAVQARWLPSLEAPESEARDLGPVPMHDGLAAFSSDSLRPGVVELQWTW